MVCESLFVFKKITMKIMHNKLVNFAFYQTGWLLCVFGAVHGFVILSILFALFFIAMHIRCSSRKLNEVFYVMTVMICGYVIDSLLVMIGLFSYEAMGVDYLAPIWIAALWAMFSVTIGSSMAWMTDKYITASVLGGIFGPLAYYAAEKIGAVYILTSHSLLTQAMVWAVVMPLLFFSHKKVYENLFLIRQEKIL